jgi:hypothetical protein
MPGRLKGSELERFIRDAATSFWHVTCTAKMGRDEMSANSKCTESKTSALQMARSCRRNTVLNLVKCGVDSIFTYNLNRAEADKVVAAVSETGAKAATLQLDTSEV